MSNNFDLIAQREQRIRKVNTLKELGYDPYPTKSMRDQKIGEVVTNFDVHNGKTYTLGGRLMAIREHGQLVFGNIQDQSGSIQLYIRKDLMEEASVTSGNLGFENLKLLDIGDIIEATGEITKTQRGETSILVKNVRILTKALRPLPDKRVGLQDKEKIFRRRYLDLIINPENKYRFEKSAEITFAIRQFLHDRNFLEIKTPILQPLYGGGMAKPFTTKINALDMDYYLAISHELYLKRLIIAGYENVFNLVGYFRNEGIDRSHNPEFTMLETMTAFKNYEYNMDLIEEMYRYISETVFGRSVFKIQGQDVDFSKPWKRIKMLDGLKEIGYDFDKVKTIEEAHQILDKIGNKDGRPGSIGESMVLAFEQLIATKLIQPTFVYGHPVEISPLAKRMPSDSRFAERFEIYIGGIEGGDNWTELNDPQELYMRFRDQINQRKHGNNEAHPMDIEFVEAMEYGMPPTTGLGPGIERLAMMFTETEYMDDVVFFPMMKPQPISETQLKIYGDSILGSSDVKVQDKSKKMLTVLNKDVKDWKILNTASHISAYLGNKITKNDFYSQPEFKLKDEQSIPSNSQYPIIALAASEKELHELAKKLITSGIHYIIYTEEMIEFSDDEKLQKAVAKKKLEDLNIMGIGLFGENEKLDELAKEFKLFSFNSENSGSSNLPSSPMQQAKVKPPRDNNSLIMKLPTRERAMKLLNEHVKDDYQLLHAKMVANGLEFYANSFKQEKNLWYITGLLHDIDYYEHPEEHPDVSLVWFKDWGYPQDLIDAVEAHGLKEPRVAPQTDLAKALIATDELCGLIYAYSLMRPAGFDGMDAKSILKKFKDKNFAAKISREEVNYGVELFGVDFATHIQNLIGVFQKMPEFKNNL